MDRVSLARFFNMAGQAMFPEQWNDEDLAGFYGIDLGRLTITLT